MAKGELLQVHPLCFWGGTVNGKRCKALRAEALRQTGASPAKAAWSYTMAGLGDVNATYEVNASEWRRLKRIYGRHRARGRAA